MSSIRSPFGELVYLADGDDLNGGDGTVTLDLTGAAGCIITQVADTLGTAGIDVIEFSRDGGSTWAAATAANIGGGHPGLMVEDGSAAAATGAALNAAGVEGGSLGVVSLFSLGPVAGPCLIRCARGGSGQGGTAWTTGAPAVAAIRIG